MCIVVGDIFQGLHVISFPKKNITPKVQKLEDLSFFGQFSAKKVQNDFSPLGMAFSLGGERMCPKTS